ncbi:MAG TPA: hypothetical protein ENG02_00965 [Candidatus Woesearchaeota archaeon]|nr:hypothetical protein [Candidatus Woesearchaeota archaeon]
MRIAISCEGKTLESNVDPRFGRCAHLLIVEAEAPDKINLVKVIDNPNVNVGGGAGISTAQLAANENVEAIITGNIGPRAFGVMQQLNIKVYRATGKAIDAIKQLLEGKLEEITIPGPMWKWR